MEIYYPIYEGDNTIPTNCTGTPIRLMTFMVTPDIMDQYTKNKKDKKDSENSYDVTSDQDFDCWALGWCCIGSNKSGKYIHEVSESALTKAIKYTKEMSTKKK